MEELPYNMYSSCNTEKRFKYFPLSLIKNNPTILDKLKVSDLRPNSQYIKKILKSSPKEDNKKLLLTERNKSSDRRDIDKMFINLNFNDTNRLKNREIDNMFIGFNFNDTDRVHRKEIDNMFINVSFNDTDKSDKSEIIKYIKNISPNRFYPKKEEKNNISPEIRTLGDILIRKNNKEYASTDINFYNKNNIKPYKKKNIINNHYKNDITPKKVKSNFASLSEYNNIGSSIVINTQKIPQKFIDNYSKHIKKKMNRNKIENEIYEKKGQKKTRNNSNLITSQRNNENYVYNTYYNSENKSNITYREKVKPKILNNKYKNFKRLNLSPDIYLNIKYHRKLYQVLLLLIEKIYKNFLMKTQYIFWNKLKTFNNDGEDFKKGKYLTNDFQKKFNLEGKYNYKMENLNKSYILRREKILINKIKERNLSESPKNSNHSEFFCNKNELNKLKQNLIIRKKTPISINKNKKCYQTFKSKTNNIVSNKIENEKALRENIKNQNQILENRIFTDNIIDFIEETKPLSRNIKNKNYKEANKNKIISINSFPTKQKGKIIIVKNISNKNNKIFIDIKYIGYTSFDNSKRNNTKYKDSDLKICNNFSIDLIRKVSDNQIIIQKLEHNHINNKNTNKKMKNNENNFILIEEG